MIPAFMNFGHYAGRYIYPDQVRLIEIYSLGALAFWSYALLTNVTLLERTSYSGFSFLSQPIWAAIFIVVAIMQAVGMLVSHSLLRELRFIGMALSAGLWSVTTVSFATSDVGTTAVGVYAMAAITCALAGVFIGWKSTSSLS